MSATLARAVGGEYIQAFALQYGKINLTSESGAITGVEVIHCVADGSIAVTFPDYPEDPQTVAMVEGDQFSFPFGVTIAISSGTFHVM